MNSIARTRVLTTAALVGALTGCADLTVTNVTEDNEPTVKGVRYYLPKPFIVFAPQADGTVQASVVYLPDKSHEYAIDTSSTLSSNAFQAATDAVGLLTAVQYNTDTTAVASQAIASGGAAAAQGLNYEAARTVAVQTQVNTAQAAVISAQSAYSAALAALNSDTQANVSNPGTVTQAAIQADASTVAQKLAALQVAQAALQTAQTTPQTIASTAAASTPIASTAASAGTPFGAQTWSTGISLSLPERYGPAWFAVNDNGATVCLKAVRSIVPGAVQGETEAKECTKPINDPKADEKAQQEKDTNLAENTNLSGDQQQEADTSSADKSAPKPEEKPKALDPQPAFETTLAALGPPQLTVPTAPYTLASKLPAVLMFNRDVVDVEPSITRIVDGTSLPKPLATWDRKRSIAIDVPKLMPGGYWLNVKFKWAFDPAKSDQKKTEFQKVLFNVTTK